MVILLELTVRGALELDCQVLLSLQLEQGCKSSQLLTVHTDKTIESQLAVGFGNPLSGRIGCTGVRLDMLVLVLAALVLAAGGGHACLSAWASGRGPTMTEMQVVDTEELGVYDRQYAWSFWPD